MKAIRVTNALYGISLVICKLGLGSTCPKERAVNLKFSSEYLSSTYPETSISGDTWNDRTQTDARKIFVNMREERKIATDVSSSLIEFLDKATQVSDPKSTDFAIEMDDQFHGD